MAWHATHAQPPCRKGRCCTSYLLHALCPPCRPCNHYNTTANPMHTPCTHPEVELHQAAAAVADDKREAVVARRGGERARQLVGVATQPRVWRRGPLRLRLRLRPQRRLRRRRAALGVGQQGRRRCSICSCSCCCRSRSSSGPGVVAAVATAAVAIATSSTQPIPLPDVIVLVHPGRHVFAGSGARSFESDLGV